MLDLERVELGTVLASTDFVPPEGLFSLFDRVNAARTHADILACLIDFEHQNIPISDALASIVDGTIHEDRDSFAARVFAALLDRIDPEALAGLLDGVQTPIGVRALIRLFARLQQMGISLASILPAAVSVTETAKGVSSARTEKKRKRSTKRTGGRKQSAPEQFHKVEGMESSREGITFTNSPQKDFVRARWGERLQERYGSKVHRHRLDSLRVFSLLGETGVDLELPYYRALGISDEHVYSAEFDPVTHAKLAAANPKFHLFPGNCWHFVADLNKARSPVAFDAMNLDLYGTMDEFFHTGEHFIFDRLAPSAEVTVNSRIRQDASALSMAYGMLISFKRDLPEILQFIEMLLESKRTLYGDPAVVQNMVLRELMFIIKLVTGQRHTAHTCCQKSLNVARRFRQNMAAIVHLTMQSGGKVLDTWGEDVVSQIRTLTNLSLDDKGFGKTVDELANTGALSGMEHQLAKSTMRAMASLGIHKLDLHKTDDDIQGAIRTALQRFFPLAGDIPDFLETSEVIDSPEGEAATRELMELTAIISQIELTKKLVSRRFINLERITYTHDAQHTFQTWMMRVENRGKPVSMLQAIIELFELLINSRDTYVDGAMKVRTWEPPAIPRRVPISPKRILHHHSWLKHEKASHSARLSEEEKARRRKRRQTEKRSRKRNRIK